MLSALAFALVHGARQFGLRGILALTAICFVVGNLVENIGVATDFPFGRYYFAGLMGSNLFNVSILLGLAYIGMAYVSWVLARLVMQRIPTPHPAVALDSTGKHWRVAGITGASAPVFDFRDGRVCGLRMGETDRDREIRYKLNSSRSLRVCARLTGTSDCRLSSMRS